MSPPCHHVILIRSQLAWRTTTTEFGGRFDPETLSVQLSELGTDVQLPGEKSLIELGH